MKLLMHVCCGPCSTHCVKEVMKEHDVTLYWHNPNIHPLSEHERRLSSGKIVSEKLGVPMIVDDLEPDEWFKEIRGLEMEPEGGKRCTVCFGMRLKQTAKLAAEKGFESITTTLSISPHKNTSEINKIGEKYAKEFGVQWVPSVFDDGFQKSVTMSKEMDLYRQKFCGCFYSRGIGR